MHWQLFLPDRHGPSPAHLIDVGAADLVTDALCLDLPEGPGGRPGVLVAWPRPGDTSHRYAPDEQTWIPAVPRDGLPAARYHVGLWTASPPTPAELKRPYGFKGSEHDLGGQTWLVPHEPKLPHDFGLSDDGSWKFERQRRFHDFGLAVDALRDRLRAAPDKLDVRLVEIADLLLAALRLNYRLLPELVPALRLFDTENVEDPFWRVITG
jgi:hypothetical protein